MKKLNEIITSIKKKMAKEENVGIVILGILILIFLAFTAIYIFGTKNISKIEENTLVNKSKDTMMYIENITLNKEDSIDKYIMYALEYSYNVNSKDEMTCEEISKFLSKYFTKKMSATDIRNMGVSPIMLNKNITYDSNKDSYKINETKKDSNTIAETKIVYYKLEKISKKNRKKYLVTYSKYIIEDPYEMLNYIMELNMNNEGVEENGNYKYDLIDTTPLINYLTGSGKLGDIKKLINDDNLSHYAKLDEKGKIKVTYIIDDEELLIDKIK